jgi:hypothetical protein
MHTWIWFVFLAVVLIKLPIAALLLWIPFRSDAALESPPAAEPDSGEDDGGSKTLPGSFRHHRRPRGPLHGRGPRRGPHGGGVGRPTPSPASSPARIRTARRSGTSRIAARR